jgi:hypothetical protein
LGHRDESSHERDHPENQHLSEVFHLTILPCFFFSFCSDRISLMTMRTPRTQLEPAYDMRFTTHGSAIVLAEK